MIPYGKTPQLRDVIYNINKFHPINKPTLTFKGTVKLHGTNGGIIFDVKKQSIKAQSRKKELSLIEDNYGFARFVDDRKNQFIDLCQYICDDNNIENGKLVLYVEYFGKGIQQKVAISNVEKSVAIFAIMHRGDTDKWLDINTYGAPCHGIYNINTFKTYEIAIDFNNPSASVEQLQKIVDEVESSCPVGRYFKQEGYGEGVVWTCMFEGHRIIFKTKGEKHAAKSGERKKKILSIVPETVESINKFVTLALTEERLQQGIKEVFINDGDEPNIQGISKFLKWIGNDVIEEEMVVMEKNGLKRKQVMPSVTRAAAIWFKQYLGY